MNQDRKNNLSNNNKVTPTKQNQGTPDMGNPMGLTSHNTKQDRPQRQPTGSFSDSFKSSNKNNTFEKSNQTVPGFNTARNLKSKLDNIKETKNNENNALNKIRAKQGPQFPRENSNSSRNNGNSSFTNENGGDGNSGPSFLPRGPKFLDDNVDDPSMDEDNNFDVLRSIFGGGRKKGKSPVKFIIEGAINLKKVALVGVFIVLGIVFLCVLISFLVSNSKNTAIGIADGNEDYKASKEEKEFKERLDEVHDEFSQDGKDFDVKNVGAVFVILSTYGNNIDYDDMTKGEIRKIANLMFDDNGKYSKDTFKENLKYYYQSKIPRKDEGVYERYVDETFEALDEYKESLGEKEESVVCINGGTLLAKDLAQMTPDEYINTVGPIAQRDYSRTGVFASVTIAQSILESGWGKSKLSLNYNNMFGIKCSNGWKGECVNMTTQEEYTPGSITTIVDAFRVYKSVNESIDDHSKFLKENSRYPNAGVFRAKNAREQIQAIIAAGYATSSSYVSSIFSLFNTYNLEKWDVTVNASSSGDDCVDDTSVSGWSIRTVAPTENDPAFMLKTANRGQCVWYAQARAIEAAQDIAKKGLYGQSDADRIQKLLLGIYGDAGDWYKEAVKSGKFNGSTQVKDVKPGSIIVWGQKNNYGHVAFVEDVDTQNKTITITEGWATNTQSCPSSFSCVNFKSNVMSLDEYYNSFGPYYTGNYNFIGYVYAFEPLG